MKHVIAPLILALFGWTTENLPQMGKKTIDDLFDQVSVRVPISSGDHLFFRAFAEE